MASTYEYNAEQGYTRDGSLGDQSKNNNPMEQLHYDEPTKQTKTNQEHAEKGLSSSPKTHNLSLPPSGDIDRDTFVDQRPRPRDIAPCNPCAHSTDPE